MSRAGVRMGVVGVEVKIEVMRLGGGQGLVRGLGLSFGGEEGKGGR